jgi:hypothetical protein
VAGDESGYDSSQNPGGYGASQQPGTLYAGKAQSPQSTTPPTKTPPARTPASDVRLHFYLPLPPDDQAKQAFVDYLDYSWDKTGTGPFSALAVRLTLITDEKKGIQDLKQSLTLSGTVVVYMGHTSLVQVKRARAKTFVAQGLTPQLGKTILRNRPLVALLEKAKANIVILAGCSTDACVPRKLKNDVIVITTASGRDGVTHSAFWARALTGFLLALAGWEFDGKQVTQRNAGRATVNEAIAVGNKFFPQGDHFVLASGDGSRGEF